MGCFRACFGRSKRPKQQPTKPLLQILTSNHGFETSQRVCALEQAEEVVLEVPAIRELNQDSLKKLEDQIDLCHTTENTCEPISEDDKVASSKEVENDLDEIKNEKSGMEEDESRGSSNLSNAFSLPLNHRYADWLNSEDEHVKEMDHLEENRKDDTNGKSKLFRRKKKKEKMIENESTESLFSLSFGSRKHVCTVEARENEIHSPDLSHQPDKASSDKESSCPNENVESVLNPIEKVTLCLSAEKVKTVHHLENEVHILDLSHQPDKASSDKESSCPNENVESVLNPIGNVTLCLSAEKVKTVHHQPDKASSDKELSCPNENVQSILNPIENVTLCLSAEKVKSLPPVHHLEKENISLDKGWDVLTSPEPTFRSMKKLKENHSDSKHVKGEIAVETSLSNWLAESETTPKTKSSTSSIGNSPMWTRNSAKSYEDRPILGALTLEELRQFSASSTPRRLRSRSPEETPIIGSVGSYWSHSGQDADSKPGSSCRGLTKPVRKNSQDEKVHWKSTPFLERLDMTLASNYAE